MSSVGHTWHKNLRGGRRGASTSCSRSFSSTDLALCPPTWNEESCRQGILRPSFYILKKWTQRAPLRNTRIFLFSSSSPFLFLQRWYFNSISYLFLSCFNIIIENPLLDSSKGSRIVPKKRDRRRVQSEVQGMRIKDVKTWQETCQEKTILYREKSWNRVIKNQDSSWSLMILMVNCMIITLKKRFNWFN